MAARRNFWSFMGAGQDKLESIAERVTKSARAVKAEDIASGITRQLGDQSIAAIYRDSILSQRTRQYELHAPAKSSSVEVLHTLLGIELKIANRRLLCPDLATARYLSVFARLGCDVIAVPYDITQISRLADDLESSWQRTMLLVQHFTVGRTARLRAAVNRRLLEDARNQIAQLGAGTKFPQFNQKTRQRR
ncbi:MAG TPA: hypothetical protein VF762_02520 [Blastocatellia bacterium]|jgi:hypothetical protein